MMNTQRIKSMDFIRALSVIMIIVFHFYLEAKAKGFTSKIDYILANLGDFGVSFFIIISGGGLYLSTRKGISILTFYKKRALTIYPSFYIAYLAVSVFLYITLNRIVFQNDPALMLLTIFGIDGFMASNIKTYYLIGEWFMGFILIIYLIYPLVLWCFNKNPWMTIALSAIISAICFNYNSEINSHFFLWNKTDTWNPLVRLPEFIFGMLLFGTIIKNKKISTAAVIISIIVLLAYVWHGIDMTDYYKTPLFISTFTLIAYSYEYILKNRLFDKLALSLSTLSFMAFLLHHQIIYALSRNGVMNPMNEYNLFYGFIMIITLSFVCAHCLETSIQKIKSRTSP